MEKRGVQYVPYHIRDTIPYINWTYFFHAWGFEICFANVANSQDFPEQERSKAGEALQLYKEAGCMLRELDKDFCIQTLFKLCKANADGDNLLLDTIVLPLLRQQSRKQNENHYLCLSDFVRPLVSGVTDTVGVFASSVDKNIERLYENDPYKHLLVRTLADRLVEAATEKMHEYVRKTIWGYVKEEDLSIKELLIEKFQGIRPATGYPSLPDQSINFILNDILDMKQIGITLTENGAMLPHASVCGLMFAHPVARYFSVGKIDEEQLTDYAGRRGKTVEEMKKFLKNYS
ncbi:Methionine synthase [termite gut metagenome]|uniref:Methionine synthase n=1 Tax=termite gut metagenome TaxID=433724 RepID=A0A5J4QXK0_9ZZZZ